MLLLLLACRPPDPADWTPSTPRDAWLLPEPPEIPLPPALEGHTELSELSAWASVGLSGGRDEGATYGLGDGRVFGLLGLDSPYSTLTNAIGPGYQADSGFFGDASLRLLEEGEALAITGEAAGRPRGLAVVRTLAEHGALKLSTLDLTIPGEDAIARLISVHNEGDDARDGLTLRLGLARADDEETRSDAHGLLQRRGSRWMSLGCPDANWSLEDESGEAMIVDLPALGPGEATSVLCLHRFTEGDPPGSPELPDLEAALATLAADADALLTRAPRLDAPEPAVADLLEGLLLTLHTQTAESGLVSPMSRYTSGWLRDAEGPVRLYLATGLYEEARAQLDGAYYAAITREAIANSFSLDLDPEVEEPEDPETFWAEVDFMEGRNAVEAPSYVVIHHGLYLRATGDETLLTGSRLAYLRACLERQEISEAGLLPWSGDETWRWPFLLASGVGLPEETGWSLGSALLYLSAADALAAMGVEAGEAERVREATEAVFWQQEGGFYAPFVAMDTLSPYPAPYEEPSLLALWLGDTGLDGERVLRNVGATRDALLQEDGLLASVDPPGTFVGATGLVAPYWLQNLATVHADEEEEAWDALGLLATPSGHVEELHGPDRLPLDLVHQEDGLGGDVSARYRPWEGGDLGASVLGYLVGAQVVVDLEAGRTRLSLSPHLPHGWPAMAVEDLPAGEGRYTLQLEQYEEGMRAVITRTEGEGALELSLILHGEAAFSEIWVDGTEVEGGELGRVVGLELGPGEEVEVVGRYE